MKWVEEDIGYTATVGGFTLRVRPDINHPTWSASIRINKTTVRSSQQFLISRLTDPNGKPRMTVAAAKRDAERMVVEWVEDTKEALCKL